MESGVGEKLDCERLNLFEFSGEIDTRQHCLGSDSPDLNDD